LRIACKWAAFKIKEVRMLTLQAPQAETLWDEMLPIEARQLPEDLARLDELLQDHELLRPIAEHWRREAEAQGRSAHAHGRPTIAMETYVRLMVVKQRTGWGYETLVREASDSLHLRRFCLIPVHERVPDESTIRKLTRRLGAGTVAELTRGLIAKATRERRFRARAARLDSTVVEADVRYPTDSGLAADGVRALAREARRVRALAGAKAKAVRDRSRAVGRRLRAISRTVARRTGERKAEVLRLTGECGQLLRRSVAETRRMAAELKRRARGRGAKAKLKAAAKLSELADRCEQVTEQIRKRLDGERIEDRLVSLSDPDARPIRKARNGKPTEFGYVIQLCEVTANTKPGARGLILPPVTAPGNPNDDVLVALSAKELERAGIRLREAALDGGFHPGPAEALGPSERSSLAAGSPSHGAPIAAWPATGSARRDGSRTSSAATGCAGRASREPRVSGSGRAGRPSPMTLTPSASSPPERIDGLEQSNCPLRARPRRHLRAAVLTPGRLSGASS
jgi:IS5 family transposase